MIDSLITWFNELIAKDPTIAVIVGTIAAALVGALVGALATYTVQWASEKRRQSQRILGALEGIHAELNTIYVQLTSPNIKDSWETFKKIDQKKDVPSAEGNLEDPEKPDIFPFFVNRLRVPEDYLIVYRSNANLIGQINNSDLRRKIVRTYMFLQIVMEGYKTYNTHLNSLLEKGRINFFLEKGRIESSEEECIKRGADLVSLSDNLVVSSRALLEDHESLTKSMKSLLKTLEEEIPLSGFLGFYRRLFKFCRR